MQANVRKRCKTRSKWIILAMAGLLSLALSLAACAPAPVAPEPVEPAPAVEPPPAEPAPVEPAPELSGTIVIDGSSTVYPISEAVAEEFRKVHPKVEVTIGVSGTGGGFKRFTVGETDITNASRPIKDSEAEEAAANDIEFIELEVAFDGIAVMVNPQNTWVDYLTVEELKKIWEPESTINRWNQIRPEWPDEPIELYGPGTESGTFDYFTEEIMGEEDASRSDYTASEDDHILVLGIAEDKNAHGYFGYAYYAANKDRLRLIPIDSGQGPVLPSVQTINDGTYSPLSRPLFIYVSTKALERPEVQEFVRFYLEKAPVLVPEVGYVALPQADYDAALQQYFGG
ncbi:phosphate transport system substrate-binding protein [Candidatus Hakubella thermalkaliphila]|uniref:Phosphate-binding protein n=3 Tax=Candidatus Hakubella thermalkaliphila TaxID=2754717 RepID=A0A6V8PPX3_9ACTN|nr:PstS family phosphate ABC transporter substrate-binding protein [Candidatus Hakubella thermalkaliphila]GFP34348.1 phosphate transport system substrate-binding protein [Candidatus Hakubella thermalkaliphila]